MNTMVDNHRTSNRSTGQQQATDNPRTSNRSTDQQQALVSIYWDYQNIPDGKQANNVSLFADSLGCVVNRKVYDNWQQGNKVSQKRTFVNLGFDCVTVSQKIRNAVDFRLSIDCSGEAASSLYPHLFIVVSGDGYGEILIPSIQEKGKKVIILARQGNENKNLKKVADRFYFVEELPKLIEGYKLAA
jgi:uncharacterized LabA/DUF88 family protein